VSTQPILRLTIDKSENSDSRCRIIARSDSQERDIEVDLLPDGIRQKLALLQEAILRSRAARGDSHQINLQTPPPNRQPGAQQAAGLLAGADETMIQEIGSQLFDFLFQRSVLDLYEDNFKAAKDMEKPLFIKLRANHPDLSYIPWETLYDRKNRFFITTGTYTPFTRSINDEEDRKPLTSDRPIRILGMAARVKTLNGIPVDAIDVDSEQISIKKALGNLDDGKRVKLCWIPSAKARDLNRGVARGDGGKRWDIFHFVGHGGFDADRGLGYILIQEDGGSKGAKLYSDSLKNFLIQPGRTPSLVVLNSCSGAQGQPGELFASTAADLIDSGIPAVIAMQFEISDNMGIAFSEAFYTYLADGVPIQEALARTRAELKARGFGEWISPVLYMRTADGDLFRDVAAATPDPAPAEATS
jgi:hypothetical protein